MSRGDDLEGLTEEATANAQLGEDPSKGEHTLSTYWKVQAMKSRGETRVVARADMDDEFDPEEPTDPLPPAPAAPTRGGCGLLVALAALVMLVLLACAGLGAIWLLNVQSGPGAAPAPSSPVPEVEVEVEHADPTPSPTANSTAPAAPEAPAPTPAPVAQVPELPLDQTVNMPPEPDPEPTPEPQPELEPEVIEPEPQGDQDGIDLSELTLPDLEPVVAAEAAEPSLLIGPLSMSGPGSEPQLRNVFVLAEPRFMACYTEALAQDPGLEATLDLNLRLLADGTVLGARARQRGRKLEPLGPCVERVMLSERFAGLTGAASLVVSLSFVLQPESAGD
jgi:hypothetical protein